MTNVNQRAKCNRSGFTLIELLVVRIAIAIASVLTPAAEAGINVGSGPWVWQNPLPQGDTLNGISCPSTTVCYAVGDLGTILEGTSGWTSWTGQHSGTTQNLHGISCPNPSTCFAVGDNGTILYTNTAGFVWSAQSSGTTLPLWGISCPTVSNCLATGSNLSFSSTILATDNAGSNWSPQPIPAVNRLTGISCPDVNNCFVVGPSSKIPNDPEILITNNFGATWSVQSINDTLSQLNTISCASALNCVAGGYFGEAVVTSDGGNNWAIKAVSVFTLESISCAPGTSICYAVDGTFTAAGVYVTFDGGLLWSKPFAANSTLKSVSCLPIAVGTPPVTVTVGMCFAVGVDGGMATDAPSGIGWTNQETTVTSKRLARASCPSAAYCYAVGDGGTIVATTNGGTSWTSQASGTTQNLADISCATNTSCVSVGANGTVLATNNGTQWSPQNSGTTANLNAVSCPSTTTCYAAGNGILATTNSGATWTAQVPFSLPYLLNSVSCRSATSCTAVGSGGHVLATATIFGFFTWISESGGTTNTLLGVSCPIGTTFCIAVGANGTIIESANGGLWAPQTSPTNANLLGVSCSISSTCSIATSGGYLLATSNGGATWGIESQVDSTLNLNGVSCGGVVIPMFIEYRCVAVGDSGTIVSKAFRGLGTGELTPRGGSSEVGEPATFTITWTVPSGKSWRNLENLDLRLRDDSRIGLWARFYVGNPSTFALLDGNGNVVSVGLPGSAGVLESPTATLDLSKSSFQGSGPTGPSVTVTFVVSFKPPAAGEHSTRVYNTELLADLAGAVQGPDEFGHWAVRAFHH